MEKITSSATETEKFAKEFSKRLKPSDIVALYGNLGAGKTTFMKGLASGLGYRHEVTSPTFIFARTYHIENKNSKIKDLHHIDLYRAKDKSDLNSIGIGEFLEDSQAVSVIEWAEKIDSKLPKNTSKIRIEVLENDKRKITVL